MAFADIRKLERCENNDEYLEKEVYLKGFVAALGKLNSEFSTLVLRQKTHSIQCIVERAQADLFENYQKLTKESYVEVCGIVKTPGARKTTCEKFEILASRIKIFSIANSHLPFLLKDANKKLEELSVNFSKCLDCKPLYLRTDHMQSIARITSVTLKYFREFLGKKGFLETITPKLLSGGSEGGANLFSVDYFKKKAFLAQSPQLFKQMNIIGGFNRVYEIGKVYRQEESNINRYLSEFTGIDLELETSSYKKIIELVYDLLSYVIKRIQFNNKKEISLIREYKNFKNVRLTKQPVIISYKKAIEMLDKNLGEEITRADEKVLGKAIYQKYNTSLFVLKDFPTKHRAFYTKKHNTPEYSKSFDFILNGEEILSGAERINDYEELVAAVKENGIDQKSIKDYLDAFKLGVPNHGGVGIGLERFLKSLFEFQDIRYFSLYPRDPQRLNP